MEIRSFTSWVTVINAMHQCWQPSNSDQCYASELYFQKFSKGGKLGEDDELGFESGDDDDDGAGGESGGGGDEGASAEEDDSSSGEEEMEVCPYTP